MLEYKGRIMRLEYVTEDSFLSTSMGYADRVSEVYMYVVSDNGSQRYVIRQPLQDMDALLGCEVVMDKESVHISLQLPHVDKEWKLARRLSIIDMVLDYEFSAKGYLELMKIKYEKPPQPEPEAQPVYRKRIIDLGD